MSFLAPSVTFAGMRRYFIAWLGVLTLACGSAKPSAADTGCAQGLCAAAGAGGAGGAGGSGGSGGEAGGVAGAGASCDPSAEPCGEELAVSSDWIASHLDDPGVAFVDVRARASYEAERLPGAVHVDLGALRTSSNGVSGQVAALSTGESVLSAAGLGAGETLVAYSDAVDPTAARFVWTLHYYGHTDARFLDGGFALYNTAGGATETGAPSSPPPGDFTAPGVVDARRVDAQWVLAHLDAPTVVLIDARSETEYAAGHIPGALNFDWQINVRDGKLKPRLEVQQLYDRFTTDTTLVAYCQTGSRASVTYAVLRWLGYTDVRVYDGSWAEWGGRPDLPKEAG